MGLGVFVMVSLWDDLDAENIRNGNELSVCHLGHAADHVSPLDLGPVNQARAFTNFTI